MAYNPNNPNGQAIGANSAPMVLASDIPLPTGTNTIGNVKLPDVATASSLAALNAIITIAVNSQGIVAIQITGTWVGTITFQGTEDPTGITAPSTSWFNVNGVASVTGVQVTSTTANGQFRINSGGYTAVRAIMTAFTSGSAIVWINASVAPSMATLAEPLPTGTNIIGTTRVQGVSITGQTTGFAATITGQTTGLDVSIAGNVTFIVKNTIAATAFTGSPIIVFEQSDDNVSWGPLSVVRSDTNISLSTHTLSANTANGSLMFDAGMEGVNWARARVTTGTTANGMTIVLQPGGMPFSPSASVIQQVLTKGTQGISGVTTQDLKDAGRNQVHYYTLIPVTTSATDTLQTLTGTKSNATVVATATPAVVTTGKTFRVTRMAATYIATATSGYGIVRLRYQPAGVVTITSNIAATLLVGAGAPTTANSTASEEATLDEGWEFAGGTGVGISVQGFAAVTPTAVGFVLVSVTGYEY